MFCWLLGTSSGIRRIYLPRSLQLSRLLFSKVVRDSLPNSKYFCVSGRMPVYRGMKILSKEQCTPLGASK